MNSKDFRPEKKDFKNLLPIPVEQPSDFFFRNFEKAKVTVENNSCCIPYAAYAIQCHSNYSWCLFQNCDL